MPRPTRIDIDLEALAHNVRLAKTLAGTAKVMTAVKADAYGHGLLQCARVLANSADALAVAICEEAVALRNAGITVPILVLEGPFDTEDLRVINQYDLWSVVHHKHQLALFSEADTRTIPSRRDIGLWLKVDTGMHRLGFSPAAVPPALTALQTAGYPSPTIISHLAIAEKPEDSTSHQQFARWHSLTEALGGSTSLLNSAGLMGRLGGQSDWIRPGYMLYGGRPGGLFESLPLRPVMHFTSRIMATRRVPVGDTVGYGGRWIAGRPSVIATIPVGYGDGYPRTALDGTPVGIAGQICPLVGRVSMDMITVDITDHPNATVNSPVELWGKSLSVDTVAAHTQTIGYELMTRLPARTPRHWLGG